MPGAAVRLAAKHSSNLAWAMKLGSTSVALRSRKGRTMRQTTFVSNAVALRSSQRCAFPSVKSTRRPRQWTCARNSGSETCLAADVFQPSPFDEARLRRYLSSAESRDVSALQMYKDCVSHDQFMSRIQSSGSDSQNRFSDKLVLHRGHPNARIMVVGDGPTEKDEEDGHAFMGDAGALLNDVLARTGFVVEEDLYITHVVKRRLKDKTPLSVKERRWCADVLVEEIRLVNPLIVVPTGAFALKCVLGDVKASLEPISNTRGKWISRVIAGRSRAMMAVFHPSYVLFAPSKRSLFEDDFARVRERFVREMDVRSSTDCASVVMHAEACSSSVESLPTRTEAGTLDTGCSDKGAVDVSTDIFGKCRECRSHEEFLNVVHLMTDDPLALSGANVVVHRGNPQARLMIVGEAPGETEDRLLKPFVGKAGQLLDDIFTSAGFDMDEHVYLTNIVKRRPRNNRTPTYQEAQYYRPILEEEVRIVDPDIIILAGACSLKCVLNSSAASITKHRGDWISVMLGGRARKVMPIFHPSYILRQTNSQMHSVKFKMVEDIESIRDQFIHTCDNVTLCEPRMTKWPST